MLFVVGAHTGDFLVGQVFRMNINEIFREQTRVALSSTFYESKFVLGRLIVTKIKASQCTSSDPAARSLDPTPRIDRPKCSRLGGGSE